MARRRTRGQLVDEPDEADEVFSCDDGPLLSGAEDESVVCDRCEQTLLLGISRESACAHILRLLPSLALAGTAAANRPFPLVIECGCGAYNRIWPVIPR